MQTVAYSDNEHKWPRHEKVRKGKPDRDDQHDNQHLRNSIGREVADDIINRVTISEQQNQETPTPHSKKSKMKSEPLPPPSERRASTQSSGKASITWNWLDESLESPSDWFPYEHPDSLVLNMTHRRGSDEHQRSRRSSIASKTLSAQQEEEAAGTEPLYPSLRPIQAPRGTRVELHVHLVGAVRPTTIWELMKEKRLKIPGDGSVHAIQKSIRINDPVDVYQFSNSIHHYVSAIAGDLYAIERIAFELCEDKVQEGVLYLEVRYSPDQFTTRKDVPGFSVTLKLPEVVKAVTRGFTRAEMEFGIIVRSILCITSFNNTATEIFQLCQDFRDHGVVGIDYHFPYWMDTKDKDEVPLSHDGMKLFNKARLEGVHRTVHAGFLGGANMINRAIDKYHAERIGHGYSVVQDMDIYKKCIALGIHFECCPWASILIANGPVLLGTSKHPITTFAEDNANFSVSTSHPTVTGTTLQKEYDLACNWGLSELHLVRSNLNALRSSFIAESEKNMLMDNLLENLEITQRDDPERPTEELFKIP